MHEANTAIKKLFRQERTRRRIRGRRRRTRESWRKSNMRVQSTLLIVPQIFERRCIFRNVEQNVREGCFFFGFIHNKYP